MEKLRNYVQHRGLPIHMISFDFKRIDADSSFKLLYTITPNLTPKQIEKDKRFNREVLFEMKEKGGDIDIRPLVREYVEVLADIHTELRKVLQGFLPKWEEIILNVIERFKKEFQGVTPLGLELIAEDNGEISDSAAIFTELIESRKYLEKKNQNLINLTKRYVTSEIIEK
jgi:hypothetical protein